MYLLMILPLVALVASVPQKYNVIEVEDKDYWLSMASAKLDEVLKRKDKNSVAKNVIVFIGDGMGMTTITAGRIFHGQQKNGDGEGNILSFERFPATGLSKTYNYNTQTPDSASTATAIFTGVKTRHYVVGLDSMSRYNACIPELNKIGTVKSLMTWAQESGRDTGIVTTTRITHATPAATYAHINNREWECDSKIPKEDFSCVKDIARQLVEDEPGKNFKVILGGGRNQLGDSPDERDHFCIRKDGRNLVNEWKMSKNKTAAYVKTADELSKVNLKETDYLLGIFAPGHLNYTVEKEPTRPSLKQMTETAIKLLMKNKNGFVLMVEGGRIDHGHHINTPGLALSELVDLNEAVETAIKITNSDETLIIVTADHSHSMTMNGYPRRGNDILGLAANTSTVYYETLTYANGPGFIYHHSNTSQDNCIGNCSVEARESASTWKDIRNDKSRENNFHYKHLSSVYLVDETHGGEDVPIYANGPMAHLLVGVHEQNYIASVISYAACMGPEAHRCRQRKSNASFSPSFEPQSVIFTTLISLSLIIIR